MKTHIQKMLFPGTWATHVEIVAVATLFGIPVYQLMVPSNVLKEENIYWQVTKPMKGQQYRYPDTAGAPAAKNLKSLSHFELVYYDNLHFNCIVDKVTEGLPTPPPVINTMETYCDLTKYIDIIIASSMLMYRAIDCMNTILKSDSHRLKTIFQ